MAGGSNGGMESYLPLALALGATVATGGTATPLLAAELGTTGGAMLGSAAVGAGVGGLSAALTGKDVARGALMGGIGGGATAGLMSGFGGGASLSPVTDVPLDAAGMVNPGTTMPTEAPFTSSNPFVSSGQAPMPQDFAGIKNPAMSMPLEAPTVLSGSNAQTIAGQDLGTSAASKGGWSDLSGMQKAGIIGAGTLGLTKLLGQQSTITPQPTQGVPAGLDFKFDRNTYQPAVSPYYGGINPQYGGPPAQRLQGYADGGSIATVEEMSRQNSLGANKMFPQAGIGGLTGANTYQNPTNTPMETSVVGPTDTITDPYSGQMSFATGGITSPTSPTQNTQDTQQGAYDLNTIRQYVEAGKTADGYKQLSILASRGDDNAVEALNNLKNKTPGTAYEAPVQAAQGGIMGYARGGLGSYSDGGQMLKGPGDGMSDDIPAKIGKHQPARLADGEFVVPADVVSHLGNGSTDAGAKHLYSMMDKVRSARTGRKAQGKQIKPEKYMPA